MSRTDGNHEEDFRPPFLFPRICVWHVRPWEYDQPQRQGLASEIRAVISPQHQGKHR